LGLIAKLGDDLLGRRQLSPGSRLPKLQCLADLLDQRCR